VLRDTRLMRTAEEGEAFERAVEELARRMDPRDLTGMLLALDDRTEQPERMWGLLHLAEDFDDEVFAGAYLTSLRGAMPEGREWMETLLIRQLNSESARATLTAQAANADAETREALLGLLDGIEAMDSPVAERARTMAGLLSRE
jgi:Immunity protein 30